MEKIDLSDKLFHGFPRTENKDALIKLKSMIESNHLYCAEDLIKNNINVYLPFPICSNEKNEFCLSALHYGKYAHSGNGYNTFQEFSNRKFNLIFSDEIFRDCEYRPGHYCDEYYIKGSIEIDKYLVGILNAGIIPDYNTNFLYYYYKYVSGEIDYNTFCINTFVKDKMLFNYEDKSFYNVCKNILAHMDIKPYEKAEYYLDIKELASEHQILLYDTYGELIDKDYEELEQEKYEYIHESLNKFKSLLKGA